MQVLNQICLVHDSALIIECTNKTSVDDSFNSSVSDINSDVLENYAE